MIPRYDDPRVLEAGNEAFGVLVRAIGWAQANGVEYVPAAAAKMLGRRSSWARLAAVGLVRIEGTGAAARAFLGPVPCRDDAAPAPSAPSPQVAADVEARRAEWARRKRDERARKNGHVTRDVTRDVQEDTLDTLDASGDVTRDVTPAHSLSSLGIKDTYEKTEEGERAPARDVTPHVTLETLPKPGLERPAFVDVVIAQFSAGRGVSLDPFLEWQAFLANAHKRASQGQVAGATEHDFRMWAARSVRHAETARSSGRVLQRDPPGRPLAYEVASLDDPL